MELTEIRRVLPLAEAQVTEGLREYLKTELVKTINGYRKKNLSLVYVGDWLVCNFSDNSPPSEVLYGMEDEEIKKAFKKIDSLTYQELLEIAYSQDFHIDPINTLQDLSEGKYPRNKP